MKINWGTGLVIGMAIFIGFIMFFVIKMSTDDKYSHDLVTEDYYKKDLAYQEEIDAEQNSKDLSENISGERVSNGWLLRFPASFDPARVEGTVFLYRPSNEQLDFDFPLVLSGSNLLIPDKRLLDGRWNITVSWEYDGKKYMYKESIVY
ncbi:MAG: FixH family protein [Flavobacteriaceae bacterium]|nr:FixH family protein [Flavobacteriaceae bacterium]